MDIYPNATIFVQFGQFLVLLILLHFLVFKPVLRALSKRQETIRSLAEKAQSDTQGVDNLKTAYEEGLKEKKAPILAERENVLKESHTSSMRVIEEARRDLSEELAKVKDAVKNEAAQVLESLKIESGAFVDEIVRKIVQRGA